MRTSRFLQRRRMILYNIPVVLFVYRRPDILWQVLDCLRADRVSLLHIFSDGPRDASVAAEVAAVRSLIQSVDWCECAVVERSANLGLGVSVKHPGPNWRNAPPLHTRTSLRTG